MKTYYIYTDGSHFKGKTASGRLGIGGVLIDPEGIGPHGKEISSFSQEILPEFVKLHYGTQDCSNPTMELFAVLYGLQQFKGSYSDQDLIIWRCDYIGIKNWLNGEWKITKPYIQKIKNEISEIIRKENLNIKFEWVKGHQDKSVDTDDSYWNDVVDKLAKGGK